MPLREAAVAGLFYPKEKARLSSAVSKFFADAGKAARDASAVVSPHAGYAYSGSTAAHSFASLREHKIYVILSPNHTGLGEVVSIYPEGEWETPLGRVKVDSKAAEKISEKLGVGQDAIAHIQEHSAEVQLPFLQGTFKNFSIVPIAIMARDLETLKEIGKAVWEVCGNDVGVIASSDFSHYVPLEDARKKDSAAIRLIEKVDVGGFHRMVESQHLSICGASGIIAAMEYCRLRGIKSGKLLKYSTSADTTKDETSVVGYAAIKFPEKRDK